MPSQNQAIDRLLIDDVKELMCNQDSKCSGSEAISPIASLSRNEMQKVDDV
jgi:hypothetical protein